MSRIKICGLFRPEDIGFVNEARPDYIGFVFAPSKRQVSFDQAKELREKLHPAITPVGVFVNADMEEIDRLFRQDIIRMAQLHGQEDGEYIDRLKQKCAIPIIKALNVQREAELEKWERTAADFLLLDGSAGGGGLSFDWRGISSLRKPYFLAGGITESNIKEAAACKPYCIDVSSGAETDGIKDGEKICRLVQAVRQEACK